MMTVSTPGSVSRPEVERSPDSTFRRSATKRSPIWTAAAEERRTFPHQELFPGARIPRLTEVLDLAKGASYPVWVSIEIKQSIGELPLPLSEAVDRIVLNIEEAGLEERAIIQSKWGRGPGGSAGTLAGAGKSPRGENRQSQALGGEGCCHHRVAQAPVPPAKRGREAPTTRSPASFPGR